MFEPTPQEKVLHTYLDNKMADCIAFILTSTRPELEILIYRKVQQYHSSETDLSNELVDSNVDTTSVD